MNGRSIDDDDFEGFYRRTWRDAVRWASALSGSVAAGEDIAQDAFARVGVRFGTIDNPAGYLRRTIVNLARDDRRSTERRSAREARTVTLTVAPDASVAGSGSTMLAALRGLPYEQRAALVLRYWADWDEATIAEALGCRPSTVRSHAKRALDSLRRTAATELEAER